MILAIDIGNTNVVIGGFASGPEPVFVRRLPSRRDWSALAWKSALAQLLREYAPEGAEGCVLSSVAPELTALICPALETLTGQSVVIVEPGLDDGLAFAGYDREKLGNDRVADAVAALALFPPPLAVFDLGTATTLSVLDREGRFLGGMILPGMHLSVEALAARTSQLPAVTLEPPTSLLGSDTVGCIRNGAIYGTAAQIDGLSARVESHLGAPLTTVVTGGLAPLVLPYCTREVVYEEHLLLKGLLLLYRRARAC